MPNWIADPTRSFLYKVQMTFYDKILAADIRGRENIPRHRRVIVIANHSSHLDYGLVQYSLENFGRNLGIVAAKDYFFDRFWKSTFFGNFMTLVPIDRSEISYAAAFKPAVDCLNGGDPILIFPEGTRSEDGVMQPFKHGIGYLALHAKADILPIRLTGTHTALPKGRTIVRSRSVRVDIGQLIPFESLERATEGLSQRRSYDLITKRLQAAVRNIHTPFHAIASEAEMEARV